MEALKMKNSRPLFHLKELNSHYVLLIDLPSLPALDGERLNARYVDGMIQIDMDKWVPEEWIDGPRLKLAIG